MTWINNEQNYSNSAHHDLPQHGEQRGPKVTKLDKYFMSKYDFGVLSLLSDNPAQVFAAHG